MISRAVMVIWVEMSRRGALGRPLSSSSRIQTARTPELVEGPAAEEFGQHDGGAIADDPSLTVEEHEGAGLRQRGDGRFGHLRSIPGRTSALAGAARRRGPVESEVLPD